MARNDAGQAISIATLYERICRLEEKEYVGEYCKATAWNNSINWKKFKKSDIEDKVGNFIKINDVWVNLNRVVRYDAIYDSQRKKIEKETMEEFDKEYK